MSKPTAYRDLKELNTAIMRAAEELGIPYEKARKTYMLYWRSVKEFMQNYPFDEVNNIEDFKEHPYSIAINKIGKIYVDMTLLKRLKEKRKKNGNNIEEDNSDVQWSNNDSK